MLIARLYLLLSVYYIIVPVIAGLLFPDSRADLFLCNYCADSLDESSFLINLLCATLFGVIIIFLVERKTRGIILPPEKNQVLAKISYTYLFVSSATIIFSSPFEFDSYVSGTESGLTNAIYSMVQVFIAPSIFLMLAGVVKPKPILIAMVLLSVLVMLARLKRLELFISVLVVTVALYENKKISGRSLGMVLVGLAAFGSVVGLVRSLVRDDDLVDYFGLLWEPSFVFRSFLLTYDIGYSDISRLTSDFIKGLILSLPEFVRSLFGADSRPFDLAVWGGDDIIRPLGGHLYFAQFFQAGGWWALYIPPILISILLVGFRTILTNRDRSVIAVGTIILALSLGSAFRDHFYSIFRLIGYWIIFWVIPYAIMDATNRDQGEQYR